MTLLSIYIDGWCRGSSGTLLFGLSIVESRVRICAYNFAELLQRECERCIKFLLKFNA